MFSHWQAAFLLFAPLNLAPHACAQNASNIVGCVAADCPTGPGNITSSICTVDETTLISVGVTSYHSTSANAVLSWTLGITDFIETSTPNNYDRYIQRSFYLGTQAGQTLGSRTNLDACALFFVNSANNGTVFYNDDLSVSASCDRPVGMGFSTQCVDALTAQASSLASQQGATCGSISKDLESTLPASCGLLSDSSTSVYGVSLTDQNGPQPLTSAQNASSNCWPTLPKSNELTPVFAFNISATLFVNTTAPALLGTTPLMNVFFPAGNITTTKSEPTVELLCMQPVPLTDASAATLTQSSAVKRQPLSLAVVLALSAFCIAFAI